MLAVGRSVPHPPFAKYRKDWPLGGDSGSKRSATLRRTKRPRDPQLLEIDTRAAIPSMEGPRDNILGRATCEVERRNLPLARVRHRTKCTSRSCPSRLVHSIDGRGSNSPQPNAKFRFLRSRHELASELSASIQLFLLDIIRSCHCLILGLATEYSTSVRKFTATYVRPIARMQPCTT